MSVLQQFSLAGRRIVVTGANTGIGQAIALAALEAGAIVIAVARSSLDETIGMAAGRGGELLPMHCDLADREAARDMLATAEAAHGPLDGLVNNAGIIRRADAVDFSEADWDAVLDVNLRTLFFLCRDFGRAVLAREGRGKIVNIASLLSFQGGIRVPAYAAAKHGVAGVTQALANEWAGRGINVNAIAPGYIDSNNTAALRADTERAAAILARIPAGRWGRPEDIGAAAVFLLSAAADYMHGAVVPVDGGWLAR